MAVTALARPELSVAHVTVERNAFRALSDVTFNVRGGSLVGILGPNGAGKSTFLDLLAGKVKVDAGHIKWGETVRFGYYDQQTRDLNDAQRLLEFIEEEAPLIQARDGSRVEAPQMLEWFLFPRKMQWGRIGSLSGGERRRLYLLRMLIHQPNVLLLDEPTNDLDVQTLTVLEEFLDAFTGCLLVASHDRYFLDRTVDFIIPFEDGRLGKRYPGPYATYRRLYNQDRHARAAVDAPSRLASVPPTQNGQADPKPGAAAATMKLSWKESQELARLETEIAGWEEEQLRLQQQINVSGSDYQTLQSLSAKLTEVETSLESAFDRWAELSERQEA